MKTTFLSSTKLVMILLAAIFVLVGCADQKNVVSPDDLEVSKPLNQPTATSSEILEQGINTIGL